MEGRLCLHSRPDGQLPSLANLTDETDEDRRVASSSVEADAKSGNQPSILLGRSCISRRRRVYDSPHLCLIQITSAKGAKYESQGQARSEASASPLVNSQNRDEA